MGSTIEFGLEGVVAKITIDDGCMNSCGIDFVEELGEALDFAEYEMARAVLITGRPGVFSTGLDARVLSQLDARSRRGLVRDYGRLILRLFQFPRPVVAAITGHALASGATLALACDVRIAARGCYRFGLHEVSLGVAIPGFALEVARSQLPPHAHLRCIGFGELFAPDDAQVLGMIDRVVPSGELCRAAAMEANRLSALPEPAFGNTKRSLRMHAIAAALAMEESDLEAYSRDLPSEMAVSEAERALAEVQNVQGELFAHM